MQASVKITDFTDLHVWQKAHSLVLLIYKATAEFPSDEKFGLVSQIRRAAVSVTSNIAEGFGRRQLKDKQHFYNMATASVYEIRNQIIIARDLNYVPAEEFDKITEIALELQKMMTALNKSIREKQ